MPFTLLPRGRLRTMLRGLLQYMLGPEGRRLVRGYRLLFRLRITAVLQAGGLPGRFVRRAEVRLWVDGREAFTRIGKFVCRARHTIIIQMFIWKDDETGRGIAQLLLDAADRGVTVDITKEAVGDIFEFHHDFLGTKYSQEPVWRRFWTHPGIHVNYAGHHDHAKVFVVDDDILLLGGMNIADEYRYTWHDYMVELRGRGYVDQFLSRGDLSTGAGAVQLIMNTEERRSIRTTLTALIESAAETIVVEHCYMSDDAVTDLLIARSRDDVRITVVLPAALDVPQYHHRNMQTIARLLTEGKPGMIRVFLYPEMIHGKIIIIDRRKAFVGSANLTRSSLDDMGEVNVLIQSRHIRALLRLRETVGRHILKSRSISSPPPFLWVSRVLALLGL